MKYVSKYLSIYIHMYVHLLGDIGTTSDHNEMFYISILSFFRAAAQQWMMTYNIPPCHSEKFHLSCFFFFGFSGFFCSLRGLPPQGPPGALSHEPGF